MIGFSDCRLIYSFVIDRLLSQYISNEKRDSIPEEIVFCIRVQLSCTILVIVVVVSPNPYPRRRRKKEGTRNPCTCRWCDWQTHTYYGSWVLRLLEYCVYYIQYTHTHTHTHTPRHTKFFMEHIGCCQRVMVIYIKLFSAEKGWVWCAVCAVCATWLHYNRQ